MPSGITETAGKIFTVVGSISPHGIHVRGGMRRRTLALLEPPCYNTDNQKKKEVGT